MTSTDLVRRGLVHYWRTHAAVVAGVAAAVTVLSGALLVGDSVRGSLRDLVLQRLGRTDLTVLSTDFFRERLADDLRADPLFDEAFGGLAPLVALQGVATNQASGARASRVQVYGVDARFWGFHAVDPEGWAGDAGRGVLVSPALARELAAAPADTVLIRVQRPTDIPLESLHGRKDDLGGTLRLTVSAVLAPAELGEFSLQPQQGDVRAVFVPLSRLQQDLGVAGRVNALLVSAAGPGRDGAELTTRLEDLVRRRAALEDLGLRLRVLEPQRVLLLESGGAVIDDRRAAAAAAAAEALDLAATPVMTYLVNTLRTGSRAVPYSLVAAIDLETIAPSLADARADLPPIVLNEWAARDLDVAPGDRLTLEYFVWEDPGRLATATADFQVSTIVPIAGTAADRDLAPEYPGISDSATLRDWDPPFPIDLSRVRPIDEEYWERYRTTPKAFIPLDVGRTLWRSRYGSLTSIRLTPPPGVSLADARAQSGARLRAALDPVAMGLLVRDVRAESVAASRGATDFGEYFTYFSFFLVVSALMLAALFFKLGVEQRAREVGLLRAVGFTTPAVRRLFAGEAFVLALGGSALGVAGAVGYGQLMMTGLRTWWVDAVGTTALSLHLSPVSLVAGAAGGVVAAMACVWWTLRTLSRVTERSLLAGQVGEEARFSTGQPDPARFGAGRGAAVVLALAVLLLGAGAGGWIGRAGAFFGAGAALLTSCLLALTFWLRRPPRSPLTGHGWRPVARLGLRNAAYRPGRSVLSIAVIASATFILVSVDAFRRGAVVDSSDPHSGTGGYALLVDLVVPFVHDPNGVDGRALLGLDTREGVTITPLRVRPGDDASCLNLYEPRQPRIAAVGRAFIAENRFAFGSVLDDGERENPWRLLERELDDGAVPVVADANSMTYVLHRAVGDDIVVDGANGPVRLRLVGALSDSIFQGELLMAESRFLRAFPDQEGYGALLVEAPPEQAAAVAAAIEDRLSDFGADAVATADRLGEFHRVENTYLSTFQTLGGLGLLLGTVGLAAVLLRNVLERRRELALLGAVGYGRAPLFTIVIAESALLLVCGLAVGLACALVAIAPAAAERGGRLPAGAGLWLLLAAVLGTGLVSSVVAARAAMQARLLDALRSE